MNTKVLKHLILIKKKINILILLNYIIIFF